MRTNHELKQKGIVMKKILNHGRLALLLAGVGLAAAAPLAPVPATGQLPSGPGGVDGANGVAWPNPRFIETHTFARDCLSDKLTGLMWAKAPKNIPIKGEERGSSTLWQNALDSVKAINNSIYGLCGHHDWRLPNQVELRSLVNYGQANPAAWLNSQGFLGVEAAYYWSSSSSAIHPHYAKMITFTDGSPNRFSKTEAYGYVWPVRGGK
jgi:hypothetical protein